MAYLIDIEHKDELGILVVMFEDLRASRKHYNSLEQLWVKGTDMGVFDLATSLQLIPRAFPLKTQVYIGLRDVTPETFQGAYDKLVKVSRLFPAQILPELNTMHEKLHPCLIANVDIFLNYLEDNSHGTSEASEELLRNMCKYDLETILALMTTRLQQKTVSAVFLRLFLWALKKAGYPRDEVLPGLMDQRESPERRRLFSYFRLSTGLMKEIKELITSGKRPGRILEEMTCLLDDVAYLPDDTLTSLLSEPGWDDFINKVITGGYANKEAQVVQLMRFLHSKQHLTKAVHDFVMSLVLGPEGSSATYVLKFAEHFPWACEGLLLDDVPRVHHMIVKLMPVTPSLQVETARNHILRPFLKYLHSVEIPEQIRKELTPFHKRSLLGCSQTLKTCEASRPLADYIALVGGLREGYCQQLLNLFTAHLSSLAPMSYSGLGCGLLIVAQQLVITGTKNSNTLTTIHKAFFRHAMEKDVTARDEVFQFYSIALTDGADWAFGFVSDFFKSGPKPRPNEKEFLRQFFERLPDEKQTELIRKTCRGLGSFKLGAAGVSSVDRVIFLVAVWPEKRQQIAAEIPRGVLATYPRGCAEANELKRLLGSGADDQQEFGSASSE
jgi:hypothetical protein